jgi:MFS transporter, MHS family, proline/betaine transporter
MGNVLEFYDFSVYAFFAPEIGQLFFPAGSPSARAVRTFTVFAGGFLMRPIGSVLLGAIGDKYGTAAALKWSIALMTIPTVVTGCLPTYAKVGMVAPFLLTVCRLLQGLSGG